MTVKELYDFLYNLPDACDRFRVRFCFPDGSFQVEVGNWVVDDADDLILSEDDDDGEVYTLHTLMSSLHATMWCNNVYVYDGDCYHRPTRHRACIDWRRKRVDVWLKQYCL